MLFLHLWMTAVFQQTTCLQMPLKLPFLSFFSASFPMHWFAVCHHDVFYTFYFRCMHSWHAFHIWDELCVIFWLFFLSHLFFWFTSNIYVLFISVYYSLSFHYVLVPLYFFIYSWIILLSLLQTMQIPINILSKSLYSQL